jgi:Pyridoxamine 5'-phosphate oxidase
MAGRSASQRRTDAVGRLETDGNVWVSTASFDGSPHMVPLSLAWDGANVLVATPATTPTARNAAATGKARLALDDANDVVLIDAAVTVTDFRNLEAGVADCYVTRVGWDPREEEGDWCLLTLAPMRMQSWNSVGEIAGRTIMRHGEWIESGSE